MILYRTIEGLALSERPGGALRALEGVVWDEIFAESVSVAEIEKFVLARGVSPYIDVQSGAGILPPICSQEVWAAGVTYSRSRTARMEESAAFGCGDLYDQVYNAHRPELFLKATPHRVVGHGQFMKTRVDSLWNVPEPELTLAFSKFGTLLGCTIGNDLSSRDIEGENPLYLTQAKVFNDCASLGPGVLLVDKYPPPETRISYAVIRGNTRVNVGETKISDMKQTFENLREHLFRDNSFPVGCYLMTGTGIVPDRQFTLQSNDSVSITIDSIGTLTNVMR